MTAPGSTRLLRAAAFAILFSPGVVPASHGQVLQVLDNAGDIDEIGPRIVAAEGGPGSNPLSSAAGYGQFLAGTWLELFERAYPTVARTLSRDQILVLRDVKPLAVDLANRYARANALTLRGRGLSATAGELSLAHAIGPGGAVNVLTAEPARPAAELLRPEAIAANPMFRGMTAGAMRQWAAIRVDAQAEGADPMATPQPTPQLLAPAAPGAELDRAAALRGLVDAITHAGGGRGAPLRPATAVWLLSIGVEPVGLLRGEPDALRTLDRAGSRVVLDAIHEVSDRPGFREFKSIEVHAGSHGELPRVVLRAVAISLLDKMRSDRTVTTKIAGRRRGAGLTSADHPAALPFRNAVSVAAAASPPF